MFTAPALQAGASLPFRIGAAMFLVLRIMLVVGAIFWLSPLRDAGDAVPAAVRGDLDALGRLARAWSTLSDEDRALAAKALPTLAGAVAQAAAEAAAESAAAPAGAAAEPAHHPAEPPPRTPPGRRAER